MKHVLRLLDVSLAYLLATQGVELTSVGFRSKANTSARDRAQVESEVLERIERYLQVEAALARARQRPMAEPA